MLELTQPQVMGAPTRGHQGPEDPAPAGGHQARGEAERQGFKEGGGVLGDGPRRSEWHQTALLVVADVVGTGVLSLPGHLGRRIRSADTPL